jgi:hypothetical protein
MSTVASSAQAASQLWGIYYTDREYAREMGDPLRTVVEATSKDAAEETARRYGFTEPWAHPVTAEEARQKRTIAGPNLISKTPSSDELKTAIQVLELLSERVTAHANHSISELPQTQLGNQYAGQIKEDSLEKSAQIKLIGDQLSNWREELLRQRQTSFHHV